MKKSFPCQALTAYYGLVTLGAVKSGQLVLVHSAAGGVGLCALNILSASLSRDLYLFPSPFAFISPPIHYFYCYYFVFFCCCCFFLHFFLKQTKDKLGCKVVCTVGNAEKQDFLLKTFPCLRSSQVWSRHEIWNGFWLIDLMDWLMIKSDHNWTIYVTKLNNLHRLLSGPPLHASLQHRYLSISLNQIL